MLRHQLWGSSVAGVLAVSLVMLGTFSACGGSAGHSQGEDIGPDGSADAGDSASLGDGDGDSPQDTARDATVDGSEPEAGDAGADDANVGPDGSDEAYAEGPHCEQGDAGLSPVAVACTTPECRQKACTNGVKDNSETALDCGGGCAPCAAGETCNVSGDCASGACGSTYCSEVGGVCDPKRCAPTPRAAVYESTLAVRGMATSPVDGTLFVSTAAVGATAAAVVAFAPGSTTPSFTVELPAEGGPLAVTDDGAALYVAIRGMAPGVVRVDLKTKVAAAPFVLGTEGQNGAVVYANAIATIPGHPDQVAVVGALEGTSSNGVGVHLYEDGVPLFDPDNTDWQTNYAYDDLRVSTLVVESAARMYVLDGWSTRFDLATVEVTADGLRVVSSRGSMVPEWNLRPRLVAGKLFAQNVVIDPSSPQQLGAFHARGPVAINATGTRAYLTASGYDGPLTIDCFDAQSYVRSGMVVLDYAPSNTLLGSASQIELWGPHGVALVVNSKLLLSPTALQGATGCEPAGAALPEHPLLAAPDAQDEWAQAYCLTVADTAYAPNSEMLYATISQADPRFANRLAAISLQDAQMVSAPWVGSNPRALAISDDESIAWLGTDNASTLVQVDLTAGEVQSTYFTPAMNDGAFIQAYDLAVLPESNESIALAGRDDGSWARLNVYDSAAPRFVLTDAAFGSPLRANAVVTDASRLYVTGSDVCAALTIGADDFEVDYTLPRAASPLTLAQGKLFDGNALLVDVEKPRLLGGFPGETYNTPRAAIAPNAKHAYRARYVEASPLGKTRIQVECLDTRTFTTSGSFTLDVPDPQRCANGAMRVGMLGDTGLFFISARGLVLAPRVLNCLPGCSGDAPAPVVMPPAGPDAVDPAGDAIGYQNLRVADLERAPGSNLLFASISDNDTRQANRVLAFDGTSGALAYAVHAGSNPGPMALSADGSKLYVALTRASQIITLDLVSRSVSPSVYLEPQKSIIGLYYASAVDIAALPAGDGVLVAANALGDGIGIGATLHRGGATTPLFTSIASQIKSVAVVDDNTFWLAEGTLVKATLSASGTLTRSNNVNVPSFVQRLTKVGSQRVVTDSGVVFDAHSGASLGTLGTSGAIAARDDGSKIMVASRNGSPDGFTVRCYDATSLQETGSVTLPMPPSFNPTSGPPLELELLGAQGVAIRPSVNSLVLYPRAFLEVTGC